MNPTLKNNQRITYLRDLPSAVALHDYIQELDTKYNVNSKDHENSFGDINLDNPIIKNGVSNTLYFAKISTRGFFSESDLLPKHEQVPPANYAIGIDKNGNIAMLESTKHATAKPKPIIIDEADLNKLRNLRNAFQKEIEANSYKTPQFIKDDTLINPTDFFDVAIDHPKAFKDFSRNAQQHICEKIYTDQGFANNPNYTFKSAIPVTYHEDGSPKDLFEVEYYRLDPNLTFHFSTTYNGWQNQEDMPHNHPCYLFWKKWDIFHLKTLAIDEWQEMREDLQAIEKEVAKKAIHR